MSNNSSFEVIKSQQSNALCSNSASYQVFPKESTSKVESELLDMKCDNEFANEAGGSQQKDGSLSNLSFEVIDSSDQETENILSYKFYSQTGKIPLDMPSISFEANEKIETILTKDASKITEILTAIQALKNEEEDFNSLATTDNENKLTLQKDLANTLAVKYKELTSTCISLSYFSQAQFLIEKSKIYFEFLDDQVEIANIFDTLGFLNYKKARYDSSLDYFLKSCELKKKIYDSNHFGLALTYYQIAKIYSSQAKFGEAEIKLKEAISIFKHNSDENKDLIALINFMYSTILIQNGELAKAQKLLYKSLGRLLAFYSEDHHLVQLCNLHLANLDIKRKDYDIAMRRLEKISQIESQKDNKSPLQLANLNKKLGLVYSKQGKYQQALSNFKISLGVRKKFFGENHPEVASSLLQIGDTYMRMKKFEKAKTKINNALHIYQSHFENAHPTHAKCYHSLGNINLAQKLYNEAREFFEKAIEMDKKFYPENHPELAETYKGLAEIHRKLGDKQRAIELYKLVFDIRKKSLGVNHKDVIKIKKIMDELIL